MDIEAYRSILGPYGEDMEVIEASQRGSISEVIETLIVEGSLYTGAVYVAARNNQRDMLFLMLDLVGIRGTGKQVVGHACTTGNYDLALELRHREQLTDEVFWFMCLYGAHRGSHMTDAQMGYYYGIRIAPPENAEEKLRAIIEAVEKNRPSAAALVGGFIGACESGKLDEALRQYERCKDADLDALHTTMNPVIPAILRGGSVADLGLYHAAFGGHEEVMRAMVARGARMFGSAANIAAQLGRADAVSLMFEQKVDQDCLTTAYSAACTSDSFTLVKSLRARLAPTPKLDCAAFRSACQNGCVETAIGLIGLAGLGEKEVVQGVEAALKGGYRKLAWFLVRHWVTSLTQAEAVYESLPSGSNYWIQEIRLWILGTISPGLFQVGLFKSDDFVRLVKCKHPKLGESEPITVWFRNRLRLAEHYIKLARGLLLATTPLAEALVDLVMQY